MVEHRIILDCDPGVDDALALMLAISAPEKIEILGITTVAGNVPLADTTRNARGLLALAERFDIPVHAGCSRPIMKSTGHRSIMHGTEGLGGVTLDDSRVALATEHAVDFIIRTVMSKPGEVTLCPIGPMTNIALAMIKEPRLAENLKQIVFMGGAAFGPGNTTPSAEFNIYVDPQAAHVVLSNGAPLTMFGLDVTSTIVADGERIASLRALPGRKARTVVEMLTAYAKGDPCLHDPCVIAWLMEPSLFRGVDAYVEVDCAPGPNYGRTVAATLPRHLADRRPNCHVITAGEQDRIFAMIENQLSTLS